jgi:branched-chain amino acid transport system substrate-binding protein
MFTIRRALLVTGVLLAAAGCTRRGDTDPVWFGHLAALGRADRRGEHARQGVTLAVDEALADGRLVAGHRVAVLHVDSRGDADAARAEAVRLITVNKAAALIAGTEPATADRLARVVEPVGVPLVVPCELTEDPGVGVLTLAASPASRGKALAAFATETLKARRAAVLTDNTSGVAAAVATGFRAGWPRGEGSQCGEWTYQKDSDRQALVGRVTRDGADVVLVAGGGGEFFQLLAQLRAAGFEKAVLHGGADEGVSALLGDAPAVADFYLVTAFPGGKSVGTEFSEKYQQRFHEPPDLFAAQAYDATRLLLRALEQARSAQPERLLDQLARREPFTTVTGPLTWKDRQARRSLHAVHLKDGASQVERTIEPEEQPTK